MIARSITPLAEHLRTLDERYRPYQDANDAAAAAGCTCTVCRHGGLEYRGYVRQALGTQRRSYRAFAVCPECGHTDEI